MSDTPEGFYNATIIEAYWEERDDEMQMCFRCEINGERAGGDLVVAKHGTRGDRLKRSIEVAEHLEFDFASEGDSGLKSAVGKDCQVNVRHNISKTNGRLYVNAYIATRSGGQAQRVEGAELKSKLARLAAKADDNTPF